MVLGKTIQVVITSGMKDKMGQEMLFSMRQRDYICRKNILI